MTSVASSVGATQLPLVAGAANSPIVDPLNDLLLAYLAHWIKTTADPRLSLLLGPGIASGASVAVDDACHTDSRFSFDPGSSWMRDAGLLGKNGVYRPALYVWERSCKVMPYTLVYDVQVRNIGVFYVFPELRTLDGMRARSGLLSAINKALLRASQRNSHPTFTYQGKAYPNVPITSIIAERGRLAWEFTESAIGFEVPVPSANAAPGGTAAGGYSQYGFPAIRATIMTKELIGHDSLVDPDDVAFDMAMDIFTNEDGDAQNLDLFSQSVVPAPTGQP